MNANPKSAFALELKNYVEKRLGKKLEERERSALGTTLRKYDKGKLVRALSQGNIKPIVETIGNTFLSDLKSYYEPEFFDVHQMLNSQIQEGNVSQAMIQRSVRPNVEGFDSGSNSLSNISYKDIHFLTSVVNRTSLWRDAYVEIDSRYRDTTEDNTTSIKFQFRNDKERAPGTVNAIGDIRDITEMSVDSFSIPYTESADNVYREITMYIRELGAQSFLAHNGGNFHFKFDSQIVGNRIKLTPKRSSFRFYKPITELNELTFSFRAPYSRVTFDKDRMTYTVTSYANPAEITTTENHNLITGDLVYFSDFDTNASGLDASEINEMNREAGHTITRINDTTFTVGVDLSGVSSAKPAGTKFNVFLGSKRIMFSMSFKYIRSAQETEAQTY